VKKTRTPPNVAVAEQPEAIKQSLPRPRQDLYSLQAIRGIAAILVALHHIDKYFANHHFYYGGYVGVDVFFVLSGFVMMHMHHQDLGDPRKCLRFLIKRFIRVFPVYWLVLGVVIWGCFNFDWWTGSIGLYAQKLTAQSLQNLAALVSSDHNHPMSYQMFIIKQIFLVPYNGIFCTVNWSLSHEVWFYALFAVAILIPRRAFAVIGSMALVATVALAVLLLTGTQHTGEAPPVQSLSSFATWLLTTPKDQDAAQFAVHFLFSPFNLEFAAGCLASYLIRKYRIRYGKLIATIGGVLLVLFMGSIGIRLALQAESNQIVATAQRAWQVLFFVVPSFLIVLGLVAAEKNDGLPVPKTLKYLGDASYSIYLTHYYFISRTIQLAVWLSLPTLVTDDLLGFIIGLAVAVPGCIIHPLLEKPIVALFRKWLLR
jgi:exopolysaccharide production protein ExoZ